jgi:hypothetical protein
MYSNVKMKMSDVPGKVPTLEDLDFGEIAINTSDGLMFFRRRDVNGVDTIVIVGGANRGASGDLNTTSDSMVALIYTGLQ